MKAGGRRPKDPIDPLAPGTLVTLRDGDYASSRGHVVAVTRTAVQVHLDEGPGAHHEIVTVRSRLVPLDERIAAPEVEESRP